jgi:hypothetical protein
MNGPTNNRQDARTPRTSCYAEPQRSEDRQEGFIESLRPCGFSNPLSGQCGFAVDGVPGGNADCHLVHYLLCLYCPLHIASPYLEKDLGDSAAVLSVFTKIVC